MAGIRPSDLHRVYIQSFIARRVMRDDLALEMYKRAVGAVRKIDSQYRPTHPPTTQGLDSFIADVSGILEEFGMEIKKAREEAGAGREYYALVNNDPLDAAKGASDYSPLEISYFRRIISEIFESYPANSLTSAQALSLSSQMQGNLTRSAAELLLSSWVSRGWLLRSKRGRYSLSPRTLMELETYLKNEWEEEINVCQRCQRIMTTGVRCPNRECNIHIHQSCYTTYTRHRQSCPSCNISFEDSPPEAIGEKAASRESDHFRTLGGRRRTSGGGGASSRNKKGKRKRGSGGRAGAGGLVDDEAEEEDDEDEDEMESEEGEGGADGDQSHSQDEASQSQSQSQARPSRATWTTTSPQGRRARKRPSVVPETQLDDGDEQEQEQEDDD